VVAGSRQLREVLVPVYRALGLDWDPATAASIEDELPGVSRADVESALVAELAERFEVVEARLDAETLALAERLESGFASPRPEGGSGGQAQSEQ
jgi:hypothetical protein